METRHIPWNYGKVVGQKPPLKPREVWAIRVKLQNEDRKRDLALFNLAIDSRLRGCDLVAMRVSGVASGGDVRTRSMVVQQKTHKPVQFEITELTRIAISERLAKSLLTQKDCLFPCREDRTRHITTRQYARLVSEWIAKIDLVPRAYGTHSMRGTKALIIYRKTGNIRAVHLLLGHTKLDSTVRYLGVEVEDALNLSDGIEV